MTLPRPIVHSKDIIFLFLCSCFRETRVSARPNSAAFSTGEGKNSTDVSTIAFVSLRSQNSTARNYVLLAVAQFPELFGKLNEGLRRHETELFFAVKGQKFFLPHGITCPMEQRDKCRRALNTYKKRSRHGRTHNPFADKRPRVAKLISFHFLLLGMPNGGVRKKTIY